MNSRNNNPWVLIGVGCGAVLLLVLGGGGALFLTRSRAMESERLAVLEARRAQEEQARALAEAQKRTEAPRPVPDLPAKEIEALRARLGEADEKLARAEAKIRELEAARVVPEATQSAEPAPDVKERLEAARKSLAELSKKGIFGMQTPEFSRLVEEFKKLGAEGLALLTEQLLKGASSNERFIAGALLEEIADPASVAALAKAAREDPEMIVRRMAAHALAVGQFPEGKDALNGAMMNDPDWGVRTNAAYGLAKMGDPRGVQELVRWYESPTTEAQYKTPILGGIADVGDPSTAYIFRGLLQKSQDLTELILAIRGAEQTKDVSLVPDLQRVKETSTDEMIREAADKAIQKLRGY